MKLSNLLHNISITVQKFNLDFDCFSLGQLKSKEWLVNTFEHYFLAKPSIGIVYILCGWYGILPAMFFNTDLKIDKIRSFDINKECEKIADQINKTHSKNWKFKAVTEDINNINFEEHTWQCWSNKNNRMSKSIIDIPDVIINTSCEHLTIDWFKKVPKNKLVILQSNDYTILKEHINPVLNIEQMKSMYPLSNIIYEGELNLDKYTRFMLIGYV